MFNNLFRSKKAEDAEPDAGRPSPILSLRVSADMMAAYLRVTAPEGCSDLTAAAVDDYLKEQGIASGVQREVIAAFCKARNYMGELLCAEGTSAVDGVDGVLEVRVSPPGEIKPVEREDGTMDYHNTNLLQIFEKGDCLCTRTLPMTGIDGINVYGGVLPYRPGREALFPSGENTLESEDGLSLLAAVTGNAEFIGNRIHIRDTLIIRGDVNQKTGDLDFPGPIIVFGDVLEGFTVTSGSDVEIRGRVEGSRVFAQGNLRLHNGTNGMSKGQLIAGADIIGTFFENTAIECGGDLRGEALLNCQVNAAGSILLGGRKGIMVGGRYEANRRIYAKKIGNAAYVATYVALCRREVSEEQEAQRKALMEKQTALQTEIALLQQQHDRLASLSNTEHADLLDSVAMTVQLKKRQTEELAKSIKKCEPEAVGAHNAVVVTGQVYPGVRLNIGSYTMPVDREYDNVKFFTDENGIIAGQVLPSDNYS